MLRPEEEKYLRAREHYRLQKFNSRMDEIRVAKVGGARVRTWPVWFIEDYLAGGEEQVWDPRENYYEYGQPAAGQGWGQDYLDETGDGGGYD